MAAEIVDQMEGMQISSTAEQASGHILRLQYPAILLLQYGVQPFLERPANIHHRRPPDGNLHPPGLTTEFYTILKADEVAPSPQLTAQTSYHRLIQAIDSLRGTPGSSVLRCVSFTGLGRSNRMSVTYRFELEVTSTYAFAAGLRFFHIDLDEDEWESLLLVAENEQWFKLLLELVTRSSDRAWFEVRSRMVQIYDRDCEAIIQDETQAHMWYTKPPRSATDLFMACMTPIFYEDQTRWDMHSDGYFQVEFFACGHVEYIRKLVIMAQTVESCLREQCSSCSKPIMTTKARKELELREEVRKQEWYSWKNAMWRSLDEESFAYDTRLYEFDSRMILEALDLSLKSFAVPALVAPACLIPTNAYFTEVTTIMSHFGSHFGRGSFEVKIEPASLRFTLYSLAMETETGYGTISAIETPPGFMKFLTLWLVRAINFLIHRRCSDRGYEHEGVHEHDDGWVYFSLSEEEKQYEREVRDVERLMRDTNLCKEVPEEEEEVL